MTRPSAQLQSTHDQIAHPQWQMARSPSGHPGQLGSSGSRALSRSDRYHATTPVAAVAAIAADAGPFALSPFVLAELDYLLGRRVGPSAQRALLQDVGAGAYRLEPFSHADVGRAAEIIDRYPDLTIGLADASIVVLAERLDAHDLLTLDERHFRAVLGPHDKPFRLLPTDA